MATMATIYITRCGCTESRQADPGGIQCPTHGYVAAVRYEVSESVAWRIIRARARRRSDTYRTLEAALQHRTGFDRIVKLTSRTLRRSRS